MRTDNLDFATSPPLPNGKSDERSGDIPLHSLDRHAAESWTDIARNAGPTCRGIMDRHGAEYADHDFVDLDASAVSGIGSIMAEQAARLGFGEVRLIDFDWVEFKNLNRILNSTTEHAKAKLLKVEVLARAEN